MWPGRFTTHVQTLRADSIYNSASVPHLGHVNDHVGCYYRSWPRPGASSANRDRQATTAVITWRHSLRSKPCDRYYGGRRPRRAQPPQRIGAAPPGTPPRRLAPRRPGAAWGLHPRAASRAALLRPARRGTRAGGSWPAGGRQDSQRGTTWREGSGSRLQRAAATAPGESGPRLQWKEEEEEDRHQGEGRGGGGRLSFLIKLAVLLPSAARAPRLTVRSARERKLARQRSKTKFCGWSQEHLVQIATDRRRPHSSPRWRGVGHYFSTSCLVTATGFG